MLLQKLPPFANVVATGIATTYVPYKMSVNRLILALGGTTFTKAMITDIKVKLGPKIVYNITGSRLDTINTYKKQGVNANYLVIDFTERDAPDIIGKELGAYDLGIISDVMTIEVTITGATAPTLVAYAQLTPSSGNPNQQGSGNPLMLKMLYVPATFAAGGKQYIPFNPRGALIKRLHFFHGGNMNGMEIKKNGLTLWDGINGTAGAADTQFVQTDYNRTPQTNHLVYDPIVDWNQSGMIVTKDAASFEIYANLSAADTVSMYAELIDMPGNI